MLILLGQKKVFMLTTSTEINMALIPVSNSRCSVHFGQKMILKAVEIACMHATFERVFVIE